MLLVDCSEWLGTFFSWINRKAGPPILHIETENLLKLQKLLLSDNGNADLGKGSIV